MITGYLCFVYSKWRDWWWKIEQNYRGYYFTGVISNLFDFLLSNICMPLLVSLAWYYFSILLMFYSKFVFIFIQNVIAPTFNSKFPLRQQFAGNTQTCLPLQMVFVALWVRITLQWSHNGCNGIPNLQPHDCLLNRLFRRRSKKKSKFRVTDLCVGNSPVTSEFPTQMASNTENVYIWWRHHVFGWPDKFIEKYCGMFWWYNMK